MFWFAWGYWRILGLRVLSLGDRLRLVRQFLRVDWSIPHGHRPSDISDVCIALAERTARRDEVMVEAGCWQRGSSVKFSIICRLLGYRLWIYDSFEGVEELSPEMKKISYDFSGEYASPGFVLRQNLRTLGVINVCEIRRGWFAETLARNPVPNPIRLIFIDCDLADGTYEALLGTMPSLAEDGCVFSQDFHIPPVQKLLTDCATWERFGRGNPKIERLGVNLAVFRFGPTPK